MTAHRASNTLRARPRPWRLTTSLTVSMAVLLVLLLAFTILTYRNLLRERRTDSIDTAVALARTLAAEVDRFVADLQTTTLAVAQVFGNEGIPLDQPSVGSYLRRIVDEYGFIRALFITDVRGQVIASASGEGLGLDLSDRPYMQALLAGTPQIWSNSLSGLQTGQVTIAFGRVIQSRGGRIRGYLVTAFYPVRLMARLQATLPEDAHIALLDRRGIVMHATDLPNLPADQRDLSGDPLVRQALSGRPVRLEREGLPISSEPRYGALVPVTTTGWVLAYTRLLVPLEARIREPVLNQAALGTLAVLLVMLLFSLIAARLIRPLGSLAATASAIARGERPRIPDAPGGMETEQLAAGMRTMARAVADREDRLHDAVERERDARQAAERAGARLKFLTEASVVLAGSLDYEETLRNVARLAVPDYADWCAVDLLTEDGKVERLSVAHVDPAKVELAYELQRRYPTTPETSPAYYQALRTGQPVLAPEVTDEMLQAAARDAEHLRILRELGIASVIMAPLTARGQSLGVVSFAWSESARRYSEEDAQLALDLARRAAVAVENARLYQREHGIAETLQRSLLRKQLPEFPGMTMASRYLPARQESEIGGDWYDALALPDGRIGLVMGDVAGRGIPAAAVMGQLQNAVRAYAMEGHPPAVILDRVTRLLDLREMATLLYLVFDPGTWTVQYANAGHLPPLVIDADGTASLLEGGSPPLGGAADIAFREDTVTVRPGSTIVLYTDGLIEVRGEPLDEGLARLLRATTAVPPRDPEVLLDHLLATLLGDGAPADDVALLALRAERLDAARLRLRLLAAPPSMPLLRHTLRRWLSQAGIPAAEIFEITVASSEAFANAIEHAYAATDAQIEIEGALEAEGVSLTIRDWGQWREPRGAHRGRGLSLMRGFMDEVTVTPGPDGTIVRMSRRLHREVRA